MALVYLFETIFLIISLICFLLVPIFSINRNGLPKNWPLIGMLPDLILHAHRVHEWCTEILEKCDSNTFLFKGPWFSNMVFLATVNPANIHYIMTSNFSNFPKGPEFKKFFDILGDGIFNSDLEAWKSQRRIAQALVTRQEFHQFLIKATQEKVEKGLMPVLDHVSKQGLVVELQDFFLRFMFDLTCFLVTGNDPGCLTIKFHEVAFSNAMKNAEEAIFYRHVVPESLWKLQKCVGVGEEKKLSKAKETIDRIIAEIISTKKEALLIDNTNNLRQGQRSIDLLTSYIGGHRDGSQSYDAKSIRDFVFSFLFAGRDGSAVTLTWFFWLLSQHPHVKAKIREELKSTLTQNEAENWNLFAIEKLKILVYLHGALCETLRLYPPIPFQHKSPVREDKLPSGHKVSPKMKILSPMYAMGRMSSIWGKDSLEFKPERWITEKGLIKQEPSFKFFAFNAGPRTCLGKEVAFTQMKAVAAAILHNYDVQILDGQTVTPSLSIILHMMHGIKVRITKRWAQSS